MKNKKKNINTALIVDDEIDLRELIRDTIKDNCQRTFTAENGKIALNLFRKEKIDVLITDIRMPDMTGIELILNLPQEILPSLKIFIVTGYADILPSAINNLPFVKVLHKPFRLTELTQLINDI